VTLHAAAVDVLSTWQAPSPEQEELRDSYVQHLRWHPDGLERSCFPAHLTAGALVVSHDHRHVLLNLHAKAKRWFHFGGHLEEGDVSLVEGALREATEESGIDGLLMDSVPLHLSQHPVTFCDRRGTVKHYDVRFLARAGADVEPVASDESLDVRWWPVDDLPTDDADMVEMVGLALRRS
jgi:8-oxo-dGTP pyrophosphatase MutT (NUDIX family)